MKKGLFYLLLFLFQNSFAQNITINGRVLNDSTDVSILYANVAIKGMPLGVSTNEMGEFSFHFPDKYINDTLCVSAIGYKSYECLIRDISQTDSLIIKLEEQIYELSNIIVFPEDQLKEIIKNVTKNLKRNYPKHKYMLNGFYRELVLKDNTYTRLIEAAIDIQKPGMNSENIDLVRINELRKSNSYIEYDWKSKLFNKINGEDNQLYKILAKDIINYHDKSYITKNIFTNDFITNYDFVLENITMIDSIRIFEIRFFDKKFYGEYAGNFSAIENHWISVREDNFAVIKYIFKIQIVRNFDKYKTLNFEDNCIYANSIYYKEYKGKYFPYLFELTNIIIAKGADESTGKGKQYMKATLLINNILTKRTEYEKVKERFSSPNDIDLYNQEYKYHPEFWTNYNVLKINPLYKQAKNDLEDEKPLEEQFNQNGK